jgi:twitching motility protein PilT
MAIDSAFRIFAFRLLPFALTEYHHQSLPCGDEYGMNIDGLITAALARGASDVHLHAGRAVALRVHGTLVSLTGVAPPKAADVQAIAEQLLSPVQLDYLRRQHAVDAAWTLPSGGRCRVSVFYQRGTIAIAMRLIPSEIPSLEVLGLPESVSLLSSETRGLVLVTGTTGSGKSTTLASLVDKINRTRPVHVLTIEDPIEFVHRDATAVISQREVGLDVPTFASGFRSALRQDPDVLLIGELRDAETVETALTAAETGHLVLSTMHTLDASESITRIVSLFPPHQQQQIRLQLSRVLRVAVSQRLLPKADGTGRVLAVEVLVSTPYARECIADRDKTARLPDVIAAGASEYGMQSFDQSILDHCLSGRVSPITAEQWVTNVEEFRMRLRGITTGRATAQPDGGEIERFGNG